ncbi:MAG TPA: diguanylate cyclase [Elusimicrobiota bacterium]|nr:diguanylate cyclase [Elusimicrobiota bacterium]
MILEFLNPAHYHYLYSAAPPVIVALCILIVGLAILIHERASRVSLAFMGLCLSGSVWLGAFGLTSMARDPDFALWWAKVDNSALLFVPSILFYFTLMVVRRFETYRWPARGGLVFSAACAGFIFLSNRFVIGLQAHSWGMEPRLGRISAPFLLVLSLLYLASVASYWKAYRRFPAGPQRYRLKTFFYAFCIGLLCSIDVLAAFGVAVYPVGYLPAYATIILLAQIIWVYRFPDITPAFAAGQILDTMPSLLFVLDHDGAICITNRLAAQMLGKSERDLIGVPIQEILQGFLNGELMQTLLGGNSPVEQELTVTDAQGRARILSISASVIGDAEEHPMGIVCVGRDITQRRAVEEALRSSETRFRQLMESNIIGFMLVDAQSRVLEANDAFLRLIGFTREDLAAGRIGGPEMTPPEYRIVDAWMADQLKATRVCPPIEKEFMHKNGERVPVVVGVVRLDGTPDHALCFVVDARERRAAQEALRRANDLLEIRVAERTAELEAEVIKRRQAEEALRNQSITDSLTGLYNRRGFLTFAEQHLERAKRERAGLLLFMADLDNLKPVNDTYGHLAGDQALIQAAEVLRSTFRGSDVIARIGGDEFSVVVLEDRDHTEEAMMERLQDNIDAFNARSGLPYQLGLSMGAVRMDPRSSESLERLIMEADAKLYEKKRSRPALATTPPA